MGHAQDAMRKCSLPVAVDSVRLWLWASTPRAGEEWESAQLPSIRGGTAKPDELYEAWEHADSRIKSFTVAESLCAEPGARLRRPASDGSNLGFNFVQPSSIVNG